MITSGSALKNLTEEEFFTEYRGDFNTNIFEHPRRCVDCNIPLERFMKDYRHAGIYSGDTWVVIDERLSPDYNRCQKCYSKKKPTKYYDISYLEE
jgi:hypothetical protein